MTVNDLISEIIEVKDFISGITVSGGEVMLQAEFLYQLFTAVKKHPELNKLSILVDSNGNTEQNKWDLLLDLVDGFMLDIKAYSPQNHNRITGYANEKILKSIQYLNSENKLDEIRFVLVPGFNNDKAEIKNISNLMQSLSPEVRKVLIKLRKHGIRDKYHYLSEPTQQEIEQAVKILKADKHQLIVI